MKRNIYALTLVLVVIVISVISQSEDFKFFVGNVTREIGSLLSGKNLAQVSQGYFSVPIVFQSVNSASGSVLISNGIPVARGKVFSSDINKISVFVEGVETPSYVELLGSYPDGSARSVFIQVNISFDGGTKNGELRIGNLRTTSTLSKVNVTGEEPQAVGLPTSQDYLISTGFVGPTVSVEQSGSEFAEYDRQWIEQSEIRWQADGTAWEHNYYDRAWSTYALWVRTGDIKYWLRANAIAKGYRDGYLVPANYMSSAHWSQLEGVAAHYLLTGDEKSQYAVIETNKILSSPPIMLGLVDNATDGRVSARVLLSLLSSEAVSPSAETRTLLETALNSILDIQAPDGSFPANADDLVYCGGQLNFMVGLLNDALVKYYDNYSSDARVLAAIKKSNDFLWTQWVPEGEPSTGIGAFRYSTVYCDTLPWGGANGTDATANDLNSLFLNGFAWQYSKTKNAVDLERAREIFQEGMRSSTYVYSKQYNQFFYSSFNYLAYRLGNSLPSPTPAPSISFSASPTTVTGTQNVTLTWSAANASSCTTSGGWSGSKSISGTASVSVSKTTTYTLSCSGGGGSADKNVTVNYIAPTLPSVPVVVAPVITLSSSPTSISSGASATLTWNATNATSCSASGGWSGTKNISGTQSVAPAITTMYALTCTGTETATQNTTVTVLPATTLLPSVTLTATPSSITTGQSAVLSWTSTNTTSCTASDGWSGSKAISGSQSVAPINATTYSLSCTGTGGTAKQSVTVSVNAVELPPQPLPIISFTASPEEVKDGQTATLMWSALNATICVAGGGWSGSRPVASNEVVTPRNTNTTYSLTCSGTGGSSTKNVKVRNTVVRGKLKVGDKIFATDTVSVRSTGSITGAKLGVQTINTQGTIIDGPIEANGYTWWKIDYANNTDGWSAENFIAPAGSVTAPSTQTTVISSPARFSIGSWVKTTSKINVRQLPSTIGVRLGQQSFGTVGQITAGPIIANGYTWWNIDYTTGPDGWSVDDFLSPTTKPSATAPKTTTPVATTQPRSTAAETTLPPPNFFSVNDQVVTTSSINIRGAGNAEGKLLGKQPTGTRGTVIQGPILSGGYTWWNVDYASGPDGWAVSNYLKEE